MRVLGISAEVQYSQVQPDGSWKKVCLSADAQLEEGEDRKEAQQALYRELAEDLRVAFSNNGKKPNNSKKPDYPQPPIPKGTNTGKKKGNSKKPPVCQIHGVEMTQHQNRKTKGKFWSHRLPDGTWCNGRAKKNQK